LWAKEKVVVFETAATITLLIQGVPIGDLPTFDAQIRSRWPYWAGSGSLDGPQLESQGTLCPSSCFGPPIGWSR
jgi:hypothetical protein